MVIYLYAVTAAKLVSVGIRYVPSTDPSVNPRVVFPILSINFCCRANNRQQNSPDGAGMAAAQTGPQWAGRRRPSSRNQRTHHQSCQHCQSGSWQ